MSYTKNKFRFPSQVSYSIVASKGERRRLGFLSLKIMPAPDACSRFCFIVKKKNGNAVFRNKCRRILRSVFFNEAKDFKSPFWIMVTVEMSRTNADWVVLRKEAIEVIGKWLS